MVDAPLARVPNLEALELEEAIDFLRYCQSAPEGAMWATSVLTGARRGEVLGLSRDRVSDVLDFSWQLQTYMKDQQGRPVVPHGFDYQELDDRLYLTRPKSRAGWRVVPLVEPLRTMLVRQMQSTLEHPHGLVFSRDGRAIRPDRMSLEWPKFRAAAGVKKDVRLHDLRHTAVDLFYLAGIPEDIIVELVGHSTRMMTRSYKRRGNDARLRHAMKQVSELFGVEEQPSEPLDPSIPVCPTCWINCDRRGRGWICPSCELRMLG
jgi:integrase